MPDKNICWFQENVTDKVLSDGAITFPAVECAAMTSPYFMANDPDNIPDLSRPISQTESLEDHTLTLQRADGSIYEAPAQDWAGTRPKRRPRP